MANKYFIKSMLIGVLISLAQFSAAQKTGTFKQTTYGNGDSAVINYYVPKNYNPANKYKLIIYVVSFNIDSILTSPYFLNSIIINISNAGTPGSTDSSRVSLAINHIKSVYSIDPNGLYICGLSVGGRYAVWYGLINWQRFRAIYAFTPGLGLADFDNQNGSILYSYRNARRIPLIIRVGADETSGFAGPGVVYKNFRTFEPLVYSRFVDSGAVVTFAPEYSNKPEHAAPRYEMEYNGFGLLDQQASSYKNNDARISAVTIPSEECTNSYTPSVTIQNKGIGTLTSATINYKIDGGTVKTIPWTGNLLRLETNTVSLPLQSLSTGMHTIKAYTSLPNGGADGLGSNDTTTVTFNTISKGHAINITESFEGSFPPIGWTLAGDGYFNWRKVDSLALGWTGMPQIDGTPQFGAYKTSAAAIYFDNIVGDNTGKKYSIKTPQYDFSNVLSPALSYDYAYLPQSASLSDTLTVYYSIDCGNTWNQLLRKGGASLSYTGAFNGSTLPFYPNTGTGSSFKSESNIDLSLLIGQTNVMFSFENKSGHGNILYLDNFKISGTTGIAEQQKSTSFEVYPNPNNGHFSVEINSTEKSDYILEVRNILGQVIQIEKLNDLSGNYSKQVDLKNYGNSIYFVSLKGQDKELVKKVVVY